MRRIFRRTLSIVCVLLFVLFGYMTLTVPMIVATAPAILTLAAATLAWLFWPKRAH